jgi:broad specificity phosphatase PhoE
MTLLKKIAMAWLGASILLSLPVMAANESQKQAKNDDKAVYIYLIRHGKTMFNTTSQVQGWSDTPLTLAGIDGAKAAALGLASTPFVAAYTSDLGRARSTAKIILQQGDRKGLTLVDDERFREWNYGGYEGRPDVEMWTPLFEQQGMVFDKTWANWPDFVKKMSDRDIANAIHKNDPMGWAETYDQIESRLKSGIEDVVLATEQKGGGNVMLVAHGGAIISMLDIFVPGEGKDADISNSSVSILKYDNGKYQLISAGDTSYLEAGKKMMAAQSK